MKISIITPSYNSAETIEDTIESIARQTFKEIEYIVIDGGSTDGTQDKVKSYQQRINLKLISEPDKGLYDAMNKGVIMATGDIIGILNSDDFYKHDRVLEKIIDCFKNNPEIDGCYADLEYVDAQDTKKVVRTWQAGEYSESKLNNGWIIPHPTFFVRKEIYQKYGGFNLDFKIAADYEFLLRLLKLNKIKVNYIPEILICMRAGGLSGRDLKQRKIGWGELKKAWKTNNLKLPCLFIPRRILFKISQYFSRVI